MDSSEQCCKICGAELETADALQDPLFVRCNQCQTVSALSCSEEQPQNSHSRPDVPMPKNIQMTEQGGELTITRRWITLKGLFASAFFFAFAGVAAGMTWMLIRDFSQLEPHQILGVVPFTIVGIAFTYFGLAALLNTTEFRADVMGLRIRHSPIPWPGNARIRRDELDQLFCKEKACTSGGGYRSGPVRTSYLYELHAILANGRSRKLLKNLEDPKQALFIEQKLERFLGIADREVSGEFMGYSRF